MTTLYVYLGVYIAALVLISIWLAKKNSSEDFLIAGRDRKRWQIMASKFASSVGVSWFITYTYMVSSIFANNISMLTGIDLLSYIRLLNKCSLSTEP